MFQYIVKRLLLMIVTLFGITVITFLVTRLTPGQPAVVAMGAQQTDSVAYDDLIEQNRRNLGLDKPMVFNLNFEDRDYAARQALRDFIRPVYFWQRDATRRLRLSGTIALEPALEIIARLEAVDDRVDHDFKPTTDPARALDAADARKRLVEMLPTLAQERPAGIGDMPLDEQASFWREWIEQNRGRYEQAEVDRAVREYLAGTAPIESVLIRGGYAVPALIRGVNSRDAEVALRANSALSGLTGFSYLRSEADWEAERRDVVRRWNSFWQREKIRFQDPGIVGNTVNIFANTQFGVWFGQVMRLDFGDSYKHKRSVNRLILERLPITIVLSALSIFFAYLIAIPIGIFSAVRKGTRRDRFTTLMLFILYSLPSFWTAQMLLMTLTGGPTPWGGEWPDWFPTRGVNREGLDWQTGDPRALADMLWHVALPVLCLTYGSLAYLSRQMRNAMLETLGEDYVRTARAKGLPDRIVVYRHAVRNSLIPIITISAGLLPDLIAGSIIIESIFTIPGMGLLSFEAVLNRDYPVVNAILFFSALLTLLGILLADLSYALVDPRIRYD